MKPDFKAKIALNKISIPVGCVSPACVESYMLSIATSMGGPEVNN